MRAKIALIVVLASFLALSALGVAAAADPVAEATPTEAGTTTAVPSLQAPACANGLDDDGDGLIDLADPDCTTAAGISEAAPAPSDTSTATPIQAPAAAAPEAAQPQPKSNGVEQGSTIDGGAAGGDSRGGVTHNKDLGDS